MHEWAHCHSESANHQLPIALLNHPNSFHGEMFKPNTKSDADSLLYSLSLFECHSHIIHTITQGCLLSPLTSTVKSSLCMHEHPSPPSLAARLCQCCTHHSHYINNGWTFSRATLYIFSSHLLSPYYFSIFEVLISVKQRQSVWGTCFVHYQSLMSGKH